jgi:hypothetical protein
VPAIRSPAFRRTALPVFGVHVLPGTIRAADYDDFPVSGDGHTYRDFSAGNAGAQYRHRRRRHRLQLGGSPCLVPARAGRMGRLHGPCAGHRQLQDRPCGTPRRRRAAPVRIGFAGTDVTADVALAATGGSWRSATVAASAALKAGVQALRVSIAGTANAFELDTITVSGG